MTANVAGLADHMLDGRHRTLVDAIIDYAIYMVTGGHISSWNAGANRSMGDTEEEILGERFSPAATVLDESPD